MPEPIVTLNEESLRSDLCELVRRTVEEMLNGILDEEAGDLVGAERYERTAEMEAYRAGHYERKLATTSGEGTIRMPKLKGIGFTTAIIERYRRRETSVEEAMIEMYLAGVFTRRIEDVSEILCGSSVSASTVSNLNERAFGLATLDWTIRRGARGTGGRHEAPEALHRRVQEAGRRAARRRRRPYPPRGLKGPGPRHHGAREETEELRHSASINVMRRRTVLPAIYGRTVIFYCKSQGIAP